MTTNDYRLPASIANRPYVIRGLKPATEPHAACPECYRDSTDYKPFRDHPDWLMFACPRGHFFTQERSIALAHAKFLAHFFTSQEPPR